MRKNNEAGNIRLPAIGVLIAFVGVAGYFGWYRKPSQPLTSPDEAASASALKPSRPLAATSGTASGTPSTALASVRHADLAGLPPATVALYAEGARLSAAKSTLRTISGTVVQTSDYCGGFAPTEEMLESLRKEKPLPAKELFVRSGTANKYSGRVLQRFVSDAEGRFKISLPPGAYCVVEASKKDELKVPATTKGSPPAAQVSSADGDCLERWYRTCDTTLKIGKQNLKGVVIKFHHTCNPPCVTGGPPPA